MNFSLSLFFSIFMYIIKFNKFYYSFPGITNCENERTKLLLKVLAISDIVIYEIRSERLNRDLFVFLSTASHAYSQHFKAALEAIGQQKNISNAWGTLGPSVIVLHETRHTKPLTNSTYRTVTSLNTFSLNVLLLIIILLI